MSARSLCRLHLDRHQDTTIVSQQPAATHIARSCSSITAVPGVPRVTMRRKSIAAIGCRHRRIGIGRACLLVLAACRPLFSAAISSSHLFSLITSAMCRSRKLTQLTSARIKEARTAGCLCDRSLHHVRRRSAIWSHQSTSCLPCYELIPGWQAQTEPASRI